MILSQITFYLIVAGIPLLVGLMIARRLSSIKKYSLTKTLVISLFCTVFLALLLYIPGFFSAVIINCNMHPGPDCEHFDDPCLIAFWTSENGNFIQGDQHNCPGHV